MPRHHEDGNLCRQFVLKQGPANFVARHVGEAVIEQHQVGSCAGRQAKPFSTGLCSHDLQGLVRGGEDVGDENEQHLRVVDHENLAAVLHVWRALPGSHV